MPNFDSPSFRAWVLDGMRVLRVPALSLAVIRDDALIFAGGFGLRDEATQAPADEHTTYAIASISKTFTATALAMLVDEGKLGWDQYVTEILPGFALMDDFATREMRVRDLLVHRSGLGEVSGGTIWYGSDLGRDEVARRLRYLRPASSFRSAYAYQNVMYLVAGQLIPAITGQSWDDFVQQRILDPLGMADSAPNYARGRSNANMATPYAPLPYASRGAMHPIPYRDHDNVGPAASLHASAWDLAQYLRLHLEDGRFGGTPLVRAAGMHELHMPQMAIPNQRASGPLAHLAPRFTTYALGWRVQDYRGRKLVQHSGGVDGMRTLVTMLPEAGLGVVALTNAEAPLTYPVTFRVLDELLGLGAQAVDSLPLYRQAAEEEARAYADEEQARAAARVAGTRPSLPAEALAGRYASPLIDGVDVCAEGGRLWLRFAHTPAFTADLEHWHYDTYRLTWLDPYIPWGLVTFQQDSRGRASALAFDQPALLDVDFDELGVLAKG